MKTAIEPHLGALQEVKAAMRVPQGMVEVEYRRTVAGVDATVKLPAGVSGELVWKGKRVSLHGGENVLQMN